MEDGQLATRFCARRMQADESVDPTQTLAELLHSNFVDNGQMSWLLEAMAQDALAPLFSFQISPLLGREINSQSKVIEDLLEEYERLEKQRTEVEDLHYWNPSDETRNELEDVENRLAEAKAYVEYQTSKGVSELTTSLEYLALAVSSTSKEKKARSTSNEETQKRSYWARYNTIKGSIAENAIAQLLCCFQIPTTFQHVHGTGRGDLVAHSLHSSFDRVWHEVKCIECISTREELQLQATIARGERIIVYHFLRLLQHQAAGFEAWMHSIMGKLSRLLANNQRLHAGQVSVYVFFYRKPLLSPRASPDLCTGSLSASLMFHGCTATELLQSARCFSFHRAQTVDYTLPQTRPPRLDEDDILLRTIQQSSLLLALSFAVPLSFSDLRKLLQRIGQDGTSCMKATQKHENKEN